MKYKFNNNLRYSEYSSVDAGYCVYAVYAEDSNCDLGGYHSNPFLGCVEGTFIDVLEYAANNMRGFYTWGGGGYIKPSKNTDQPIILDSAKKIKLERKEKINKISNYNIDNLIENINQMSIEEIKNALIKIKDNLK